MTKPELEELLTQARRFNQEHDVSGLLIYRGGNFLQILEGPIEVLTRLYSRILHDKRHTDIRLLLHATIEKRMFERWHMGLLNLEERLTIDQARLQAITNMDISVDSSEINIAQKKALAIARKFRT